MSDTRHVSLDFIASRLEQVLIEMREIRLMIDFNRSSVHATYDRLAIEIARTVGKMETKLESIVAHFDDRFDQLEQLIKKA